MLRQKPLLGELPDWTRFPKPVGLWLMNEGAGSKVNDLSGNGNTGTISGLTWQPGKFGSCLYGDGNGNHVNLGDRPQIEGVGAFSISLWAMIPNSSIPATQFIAAKYGAGGDRTFALYTTDAEYAVMYVYNSIGSSDYGYCLNVFKTAYKWRHIVGVYDGVHIYVYVDGLLGSDVGDLTGVTGSSSEPMVLFAENDGSQNDFNGSIDDVMLFNRALTASEIAQLYREPFPWFAEDEVSHLYLPGGPPSVKPYWYYQQMQSIMRRTG